MSYVTLRKYNDAIKWGVKKAGMLLPLEYYRKSEHFMAAYAKEMGSEKQEGRTDEEEANPIPVNLFKLILNWAVEAGNIVVWVFSLLMWNCMSRSINIGVLALPNFNVFNDCIKINHFTTKTEKAGTKINLKHCYCNSTNPIVNLFLALGIYFTLNQLCFQTTSYLFKSDDTKDKIANNTYCAMLTQLFKANSLAVKCYIRLA